MISPLCPYPSDLSDQEWKILAPLIPPAKAGSRPRKWPMHEILNAIFFYVVRTGCQWRLLPHDFPPWSTVHHYFRSSGAWMALGRRSTRCYVKGCAYVRAAIANRAPESSIPNP
jgi:transposase